ncbi:MAG: fibronectin type III domain-containing protein, partial [Verrucomicrobiae bacterium]|nr:fibronectin type III domain-containing protein [Verrucomicrobiae bacterium]
RHTATITGLEPGTRYLLSVDPACGGTESEPLSFYTAPPEGSTQFLRLRLVCLIFSNVTENDSSNVPGAREPAPKCEIDQIKWEMRQTELFYWVNTGMRLHLDVDYLVDDRYYEIQHDVYGLGYTGKDESAFEELLAARGRKVTDYDGRIFISIVKRWNPHARSGQGAWEYVFGGGGTIGPEEYPGYGKSAWRGGGTSNSAWLFCHEFQHQLDALYHWSMGPEHLFNHFQPWDDTAHRHGEHWDGNGWIFWEWAGYVTREHQWYPLLEPKLGFRYFTCRWGEVIRAADIDNDGIPDDAPEVPLDEKRFGSDPTKVDTDHDGLTDIMEVMACRWLEFGLGEIWGGDQRSHYCDPRNPDTDKDGLPDGLDPYPIYPINPHIRKVTGLPGEIPTSSFRPFVQFRDIAYEANFQVAWTDEYFGMIMSARTPPANMRIMVDANDDGWFVGGDNYDLRIHPEGDAPSGPEWRTNQTRTFAVAFHNCSVQGKWPFYDPEWQNAESIQAFQEVNEDNYTVQIRFRRSPAGGLDFQPGKKIGILIAINPKGGNRRLNQHGALTVFEPHTFFTFTLSE